MPVAWVIMQNKQEQSYVSLLNHFKENFPELDPTDIMKDFETAVENSFKKVYPNAKTYGCHFHYAQV